MFSTSVGVLGEVMKRGFVLLFVQKSEKFLKISSHSFISYSYPIPFPPSINNENLSSFKLFSLIKVCPACMHLAGSNKFGTISGLRLFLRGEIFFVVMYAVKSWTCQSRFELK